MVKQCEWCKEGFEPKRVDSRFCCRNHAQLGYFERQKTARQKLTIPLEPEIIKRLTQRRGEKFSMSLLGFAESMGVARSTMLSALSGLPIHPGTRALILDGLGTHPLSAPPDCDMI